MEKPSSYSLGAGGKMKKPFSRKPPPTPYARPRTNNWLSKIVDPAYRLISTGATKFMPSFFSKPPSTSHNPDNYCIEEKPSDSNDNNHTLDLVISKYTGEAGPSEVTDRLKDISECDELQQDNKRNPCDDSELSKIEQLVKGKKFSRDEINRLTDILNSKVVEPIDVELEWANRTPCLPARGASEKTLSAHESPISSVIVKREEINKVILETPAPFPSSNVREEVSSPVDIARAFMGSRTSEAARGSHNNVSRDERTSQQREVFAQNHFIPQSSPRPSACWPGAMIQHDQHALTTPQSQRGTFSLHNLPRTPYSRTIYSKSKTKLAQSQADGRGGLNISSSPFQHSRTPIYQHGKSKSDVVDTGYGSVGPIRRIRNKFVSDSPAGGSTSLYSGRNSPQVEKIGPSKFFWPATVPNKEERVPMNSPFSGTVKKILEQLDNHIPSPKEKEMELKLATSGKRRMDDSDVTENQSIRLGLWKGVSSQKKTDLVDQVQSSAEGNDDKGKSILEGNSMDTVTANTIAKASTTEIDGAVATRDASTTPVFGFKNISDSQIKSTNEKPLVVLNNKNKDTSQLGPFQQNLSGPDAASVPNPLKKPPTFQPSSTKPNLKSISVAKKIPQSLSNGLGFTFPVSASSGLLSEPPTPSIFPTYSPEGLPRPKEPAVPSYTFGAKKSTQSLVFDFPTITSTQDNASDLKFTFGSDKRRVSFKTVGKEVCF